MGQTSRVLPWQPTDSTNQQQVYHPEPVLFIHGINDNDNTWGDTGILGWGWAAIPKLKDVFAVYDLPRDARANFVGERRDDGYNARQEAYLHTFNYGDQPGQPDTHNKQSFEHIEWNAWEDDLKHRAFTNFYLRAAATNVTVQTLENGTSPSSKPWKFVHLMAF